LQYEAREFSQYIRHEKKKKLSICVYLSMINLSQQVLSCTAEVRRTQEKPKTLLV